MSGDFPFAAKIVSPVKCNEKPWDLWVSELGHLSPRRDEEAPDKARAAHPYKPERRARRAMHNRLRLDSMSLHGLFPQMDNLNAAVCHMCGVVVKCSSAYRHLLESHTEPEPILPPPAAPTVKLKVNRRHKKEIPPPLPPDLLPVKMETSPIHTATPPLSRIVLPQPELYLGEASTSSAVTGEVQVCVESGELPVVSIQDTEDLPLGENITEDIFAIINQEANGTDDMHNVPDWKNIIRDIGNMQEINFPQTTDPHSQDLYNVDAAALSAYTISDTDLSSLQFAPNTSPMLPTTSPMLPTALDPSVLTVSAPPPKPVPTTPTTKATSRSKSNKTKFNLREYDPNKHCGVVTAENPKPCTRSLTCKAHALSLRRTVEGRAKPFDTLLAEHRAAREPAPAAAPPEPAEAGAELLAGLLAVDEPLPEPAALALLSPRPVPEPAPAELCWYAACPRPLALCTFNASHAGGAITLGKKFATVRSNIKSSLTRSQCKSTGGSNSYYYNPNALSLSKTVHMNASKTNKPEVRKLIVTCSGTSGNKEVQQTLSELFESRPALNGHVARPRERAGSLKGKRPAPVVLDLGFALDSLLADEKC